MIQQSYIYIMANQFGSVLYTGVTTDLKKRAYAHRNKMVDGFTKKYNLTKLVYYEVSESIESAILREKQIKGWIRVKKDELVTSFNPSWRDLYDGL